MITVPLVALLLLVVTHVFAGKLRFLEGVPRSHWLSLAGGVSVAYVFVHLLPELGESQEVLQDAAGAELLFVESHAYLVALMGLVLFYGLDRLAGASRKRQRREGDQDVPGPGVFWVHVGSFAVYNALIGYLLEHRDREGLLLFAVAIALHFVVNDFGMREHHKHLYDHRGRWIISAAVIAGWLLGLAVELPEPVIAVVTAFLAGGILINVFKEELPSERESRYWPFLLGVTGYSALLLAL